jgi:two-component system chemotaxis response regulator CheB
MVWEESVRCWQNYVSDEFKYSSPSEHRLEQYRGEWGLHPTWIQNWICDHALVRPTQRLIVVGASAGGVKALCALVKALPAPSPVPMYIVLHTGPDSLLDEILTACDSHCVRFVEDGERIEKGIYVSRPRRHLVVNAETIGVSELNAPKRELWIPSIDELFESTAKSHGARSVGVILSGTMHDGVAGLLAIRNAGGTTIAQEPEEAKCPEMPIAALNAGAVDFCLPIKNIAAKLTELSV